MMPGFVYNTVYYFMHYRCCRATVPFAVPDAKESRPWSSGEVQDRDATGLDVPQNVV